MAVVDTNARRLVAAGLAGPGNPNVVGVDAAAHNLAAALAQVSGQLGPARARVADVVVGGADPSITLAAVAEVFTHASVKTANDVELLTYSVGAPAVAVVGGTGSIAVRVDGAGDAKPARRGGWGWYLGDEGSGSWIGREAVRAVLRRTEQADEESASPTGDLFGGVAAWAQAERGGDLAEALFLHVYRQGAAQANCAELAPVVTAAASRGDADAEQICVAAAELIALAAALVHPGDAVVFGGSVACALEQQLRAGAARQGWGNARLHFIPDGIPGAIAAAAGERRLAVDIAGQWASRRADLARSLPEALQR